MLLMGVLLQGWSSRFQTENGVGTLDFSKTIPNFRANRDRGLNVFVIRRIQEGDYRQITANTASEKKPNRSVVALPSNYAPDGLGRCETRDLDPRNSLLVTP